jgi:hypothetical protein
MENNKEVIIIDENFKTDPKIDKKIIDDLEYMSKNYNKLGLLTATPINDKPHDALSMILMLKPANKPSLSLKEVD